MFSHQQLNASLFTGFINRTAESKPELRPHLLLNDYRFGKKVLGTLLRELKGCDEFWFSVAFITTSGVATIVETLRELQNADVQGKVLTSQYLNFTQPEALRRLKQFENIQLRIATSGNFHSKGYLFKKQDLFDLIIGSSNLTANALTSNKEWNLKVTATEQSELVSQVVKEFTREFDNACPVDDTFIEKYEEHFKRIRDYQKSLLSFVPEIDYHEIKPNLMQREALSNISKMRADGKKKALLISATGTGKTYLSAFDVKNFKPRRMLFLVHRRNIAEAALKTYQNLFEGRISTGLYSGNEKDIHADFVFSTVQTLSKEEHLKKFESNHFDYIVIDESHRAGAKSYQKIMDYFEPEFLLGMTATPERTDGFDVFSLFDYNIAYEIRLHQALQEEMLSPFHYYGVSDLSINGTLVDDVSDFNLLTAEERVDRIVEKISLYGCDDGTVRGLVFCSRTDECEKLSLLFGQRGFRTISLTGDSSDTLRAEAINRLEIDDPVSKLDYIFTVDIFNEGVDIPRINQIVMLRPTESAIVFVQQLGRGLRKTGGKEYLTVIDFIGNYQKNYLVPIALYGDNSYSKDAIRKLMSAGSQTIPGSSTINFDKITRERIFEAIDSSNLSRMADLRNDFELLRFKLGHIPTMCDFVVHGSRDPMTFVEHSKSYLNFVKKVDSAFEFSITEKNRVLLEYLSGEINNTKRVEESKILLELILNESVSIKEIQALIQRQYGYMVPEITLESCLNNLNLDFITKNHKGKMLPVSEIFGFKNVVRKQDRFECHESFKARLEDTQFKEYLIDSTKCAIKLYDISYNADQFINGFQLYRKYSRKDVFRILNWERNPVAQNVGGYILSSDRTNCPIFVNYHKHEDIAGTIKYDDAFLNRQEFQWMSKSKRTLNSSDVVAIRNHEKKDSAAFSNGSETPMRIPLFIKKSNDEGQDFYYMGDVKPIDESFEQSYLLNDENKKVPVVKLIFKLEHPVEENLYDYLTETS